MAKSSRTRSNPAASSRSAAAERPDVFRFHDYRAYLKQWFAFQKQTRPGFSHRVLCEQSGIALGYLSVIFSGSRQISLKTFLKLLPHLELDPTEQVYLENLIKLQTSESHAARISAMERIGALAPYQKKNPQEAKLIAYMSRWYHVSIRQMAILPDFKLDPKWIQERLKIHLPIASIKEALDFLTENGYLQVREDGTVIPPEEHIDCAGEIYRTALTQYHKQMFTLAMLAIDHTPSSERKLLGHTFNIDPSQFERAQAIIDEVMRKLQELPGNVARQTDSVFHVQLAIFPMTHSTRSKGGAVE